MKRSFSRRPELETPKELDVFFYPFFLMKMPARTQSLGIKAQGDKQANPVIIHGLSTAGEGSKHGRR